MGNVCDVTGGDRDAAKKNREIESYLQHEKREQQDEIKLLLLGTGGSGKSTVAKQMKIIHLSGFTEEERLAYKNVVFHNVIRPAQTLIEQARMRDVPLRNPEAVDLINSINLHGNSINYTPALAQAITAVWADPGIKEVFNRSNEFQLDDCADFFLGNAERFCAPNFTPTETDILKVRAKTTGIVEVSFLIRKKKFRLVDVGGQRNERKKWIHCFQDVTAIIFCAAMNEYDMLLEEDQSTNRMHESLKVFGEVTQVFPDNPLILFLNKNDLFEQKIKVVDLSCCFPVYTGGMNYEAGSQYIKKKFLERNISKGREIFTHFTCATDTSNVRFVFNTVEKLILERTLEEVF